MTVRVVEIDAVARLVGLLRADLLDNGNALRVAGTCAMGLFAACKLSGMTPRDVFDIVERAMGDG